MKKNYTWFFILIVIVLILVVVWRRPTQSTTSAPTATQSSNHLPVSPTVNTSLTASRDSTGQTPQPKVQTTNARAEFLKRELESKNAPVMFFGRVVDQDGNEIAGVHISLHVRQWQIDANWGNKFPKFERTTDSTGSFSVENADGDYLTIDSVVKEGYRLSSKAPNSFGYGNVPIPFHPDPQNPVIIRMWKLGESAKLISHRTLFGFQPDGRIYTLDLLADTKTDENTTGDLQIQFDRQKTLIPKEPYPWTLQISAIGGGLVEKDDEFGYLAPENGYKPKISFEMQSTSPKALPDVIKDYYFSSRSGKVYGVIHFEIYSDYNSQSAILIDSRLNPAGSRNLQP